MLNCFRQHIFSCLLKSFFRSILLLQVSSCQSEIDYAGESVQLTVQEYLSTTQGKPEQKFFQQFLYPQVALASFSLHIFNIKKINITFQVRKYVFLKKTNTVINFFFFFYSEEGIQKQKLSISFAHLLYKTWVHTEVTAQ